MLPNFLIIGANKAGTTSLYRYLDRHPDVFMPEHKEPRFFSDHDNWARGTSWYERFFESVGDEKAVGEASPQYTTYPWYDAAPRIAEVIPHAKLIYLVRNPIDRAISQHKFATGLLQEHGTLEEAIHRIGPEGQPPHLVASSSYAMQIERYLEFFAREQLLILVTEDLKVRRSETVNKALAFIGIDTPLPEGEVSEEFNRTEGMRRPRARWLSPHERVKLPGYSSIVRLLPGSLRTRARRWVTKDVKVDVTAEAVDELASLLKPDVEKLKRYMAPGFDGWGLL